MLRYLVLADFSLWHCGYTYRSNQIRGYKEEGTITTPFDMTVLNDLDRFHLVMDCIERLPQTGEKGVALKRQLMDRLVEHRLYINKYGQDMPEIRNWRWGAGRAADRATK